METVRIETVHNVALNVQVATIVARGMAVVVDWVVLFGWSMGLWLISNKLNVHWSTWTAILFFGVPWTFYHLASELFMEGQSLGKRVCKIKVVRLDGQQAGPAQYLLRWLLRLVDSMFFLGAVVILLNGKGQRLGDMAAGTTVISLKKRVSLDDLVHVELDKDHRVTFPDAGRLTDAEARLIREVLNDTSAGRQQAVEKLDGHYRSQFTRAEGMPPVEFLQVLLKDHYHLTSR